MEKATKVVGEGTLSWRLTFRPGIYRYRSDRPGSTVGGRLVILAGG